MSAITENRHYIYVYLDPRKPGNYIYKGVEFGFLYEPFYAGKGCGNRWFHHIRNIINNVKDVNPKKINKMIKIMKAGYNLASFVIKIYEEINPEQASKLEDEIINKIGKSKDKKGPLTNIGDANNSGVYGIRSEETKKKQSEAKIGIYNPIFYAVNEKNKGLNIIEIYGEERAEEIRQKLINSHIGKKPSEETKNKMSASQKGLKRLKTENFKGQRKTFKFISPVGIEYIVFGRFEPFCRENNLPFHIFRKIVQKIRKKQIWEGWQVYEIKTPKSYL